MTTSTPAQVSNTPALRMNAYYFGFTATGVELVDRVLSAVAHAGKGYHHTESWTEPTENYGPFRGGEYGYAGWIQRAAEDAAQRMTAFEAIVRALADVYTVDTDQAALIGLVAKAKALVEAERQPLAVAGSLNAEARSEE